MTLKPSVQLYTLRDFIETDLPGTIARVAEIGFTQVEPYAFVDKVDALEKALVDNNLGAPTGHAHFIGEDAKPILEAAKRLGIKTLIDPFTTPEDWKSVERIDFFAAELNRISAEAKEYGIRIAYHNHYWELAERVGDQIAFDYFIEKLSDDVVIELDAFWCEVGGVSAPEYLKKHGARIVAIHVKDGTKDGNLDNQVPAGTGEIPIREILAAAPHALPVVEFDFYKSGDVFEGIAQSLKFVNEVRA
ncbi:MAG: sugar phosphate isomerase/epimerase family protein [Micrococcales bacterium]